MNKVHKQIISDIIEECNRNGIAFVLSNRKKVKLPNEPDELAANGFFCEKEKVLAVAGGHSLKKWFWILLHEYNHMLQWKSGNFFSQSSNEMDERFWGWLSGEIELSKDELNAVVENQRNCEIDCEKRTVKMILENPGVGLNVDEYVKKSNAYLYFYSMVKLRRKWYKKAPYEVKEIIDMMPVEFVKDYNKLPKGFKKLVDDNCFAKNEIRKRKVPVHVFLSACECGDIGVVKNYIKSGGDVNVKDNNGYTPLMFACLCGNEEIVEMLLNAKCDVNAKSIFGKTAFNFIRNIKIKSMLKQFVDDNCFEKNRKVSANDFFGACLGGGNIGVVKNYIKNGGDVNIKDNSGYTPLMRACICGNEELIKVLLNAKCDVNAKDKTGFTAYSMTDNKKIQNMLKKAIIK
jgi:hypothetical protein